MHARGPADWISDFCSSHLTAACSIRPLFFFQAEDGIRDRNVTGVQTCALPILQANLAVAPSSPKTLLATVKTLVASNIFRSEDGGESWINITDDLRPSAGIGGGELRSEERRVGEGGGGVGGVCGGRGRGEEVGA